jgi:hypothetical protein
MQYRILFAFLSLSLLFATGCEDAECPYMDKRLCDRAYRDSINNGGPGPVDTTLTLAGDTGVIEGNVARYAAAVFAAHKQKAILEYYTGFRCSNCPPASNTAKNLANALGSSLVLSFMHVTSQFAQPIAQPPAPYSTNMRTQHGDQLMAAFQISGLPKGTINRRNFGTGTAIEPAEWGNILTSLLQEAPPLFLQIRRAKHIPADNVIRAQVAIKQLGQLPQGLQITIATTEDGIVDAQKDGIYDIIPYTHNYVFRGNANGLYGQPLTLQQGLSPNDAQLFELDIPVGAAWSIANCKVIAHVSHEQSLQIIQVDEKKVTL